MNYIDKDFSELPFEEVDFSKERWFHSGTGDRYYIVDRRQYLA